MGIKKQNIAVRIAHADIGASNVNPKPRSANMDKFDEKAKEIWTRIYNALQAVVDPSCITPERIIAKALRESIQTYKEEISELEEKLKVQDSEFRQGYFRGNSIGYIYDKMSCYRDQIMTAYDALRMLGCDTSSANGNIERRKLILEWAELTAEKLKIPFDSKEVRHEAEKE
jgi:hypothetical protein